MSKKYHVVVVGGGLGGVAAAIAAARLGCTVALVQDRPFLGGNSSSEIRVPIGGACDFNPWARETGIIEELFIEDRIQNAARIWPGHGSSIWDLTLYTAVKKESNIDLFLDTSARRAKCAIKEMKTIQEIECVQIGTEKELILQGEIFVDATGDGVIAEAAGAETRMGRESNQEFGESLAPARADNCTQGSSLLFHARDVGRPVPFVPPDWVPDFPTDQDLPFRPHKQVQAGYWWIEIGNPPFNTIMDNDKIRHELVRQLLGVWNHLKNYGDHGAENLVLDWIGMIPGKRESRRIMGDYILRQQDVTQNTLFPDRVAYGGWFIDLHTPGGILATDKPPEPTFPGAPEEIEKRQVYIYSIPFRCLYSKDIGNLLMAGRDISVTHVALGTTRLMATCAIMGQVVGTAAYLCHKYQVFSRDLCNRHMPELQQLLLKQGCFIPQVKNEDPEDLSRRAKIVASSSARLKFEEGGIGEEYDAPHQRYISLSNLNKERAQLFPVSADYIDQIELLLESRCSSATEVELKLRKAETLWDFTASENLKQVTSTVPGNRLSWVRFDVGQLVTPGQLYWISVQSRDGVFWRYSGKAPTGTVSASKIINKWALQRGAYSMRVTPQSNPYEAENVLTGVACPEEWTNIWISDPGSTFPQWLSLDFGKEVSFNTIYLIFDTNLNRTHMSTPGLFHVPECIKDYTLYYEEKDGNWKALVRIQDNYQWRRVHHFDVVTSRRLRLEICDTNGDRSARVYEIRVYQEQNRDDQ